MNNKKHIDPILRDRLLPIIDVEDYSSNEKKIIIRKYLIPKILKNIGQQPENIILDDSVIDHILMLCNGDEGIRPIEDILQSTLSLISLNYTISNTSELKKSSSYFNVTYPFHIKKEHINLNHKNPKNDIISSMYI